MRESVSLGLGSCAVARLSGALTVKAGWGGVREGGRGRAGPTPARAKAALLSQPTSSSPAQFRRFLSEGQTPRSNSDALLALPSNLSLQTFTYSTPEPSAPHNNLTPLASLTTTAPHLTQASTTSTHPSLCTRSLLHNQLTTSPLSSKQCPKKVQSYPPPSRKAGPRSSSNSSPPRGTCRP